MTREEADFIGGMNMCDEISNEAYKKIMCYCEEQEPCGDAVSRQSAISLADDLKQDLPDDERIADMVMAHNEGILEYQTQLSLLSPVTPQPKIGRWIPVSERLPEYSGDYFITIVDKDGQHLEISWFYPSDHVWSFRNVNVIAWMPLPKPYKAESEG